MSKKKILVIREKPLKLFIHCIPAFAAIRKFHANDEITILTEKSLVRLCKRSKFFDKVWLDSKPEWFQFLGIKDLAQRLRAGNFDMVYDLQNEKRSAWYFKLLGFKKPKWNSSVVEWCSHFYKATDPNQHFQDLIASQLKVAGIKSIPQIDISFMGNEEADKLPQRYAMFCAGGDKDKSAHKWDPLKYAELIEMLHEKHNITSLLVGDGGDDRLINALVASACVKAKPIDLSGKNSLSGTIAVARKAIFCIGNETALTHLASFTGTRTIMFCSRFSPSELIAPRVSNMAIIEEPALENVDTSRAIKAIEEFGLIGEGKEKFQAFKVAGSENLVNS